MTPLLDAVDATADPEGAKLAREVELTLAMLTPAMAAACLKMSPAEISGLAARDAWASAPTLAAPARTASCRWRPPKTACWRC